MKHDVEREGKKREKGVHPAGVVVSSTPIEDVAPIYEVPGKGRVIGLDGWDAEFAGLVKIDVLAIDAITLVQDSREAILKNHGVLIDFYGMNLEDEATMKGFTDVDVLGIFQFSGKATKNTLRQIKPTNFTTLVDINTLSRPGAMLAGTTDQYVAIVQGRAEPVSIHPIVDEITASTFNLVLYQEQVLRIMREFGGLSWKKSSEVRRFMSKRMGVEILDRFKDDFVNGAAKNGIGEELAISVWMATSTFGAYGFNRSHSLSYSMLSWWQMYVKQHYPREFYYAALKNVSDADRRALFISEAKRKGVDFLPLDANLSDMSFSLEKEGIRYGLKQVKGVGQKTAELIVEGRPFENWDDLLRIKGVGQKTADLFREAHELGDDLFGLKESAEKLSSVRSKSGSISIGQLLEEAETPDTSKEFVVAGNVISRNYRQEEKLSEQARSKKKAGQKSDTVILYIRDEEGESFPVVVPGWLASRKSVEIWEGDDKDVYLIRGKLPVHGKFFLANGLANTNQQDDKKEGTNNEKPTTNSSTKRTQLSLGFRS